MSTEYHKIQTVFKRDPETKHKTLLEGEWTWPEFKYLAGMQWIFTEKVDGMNIRVVWEGADEILWIGSKTDNVQIPSFLMDRLYSLFDPRRKLFGIDFEGLDVVLYGEGYGAKIQSGGKYRPDRDFVLFDVRIGKNWQDRDNVEQIAKQLHLDVVPRIGTGTLFDMVEMTRKGFKSEWDDFTAEGIVARPAVELLRRTGERIITKIKHKDFAAQEAHNG